MGLSVFMLVDVCAVLHVVFLAQLALFDCLVVVN
jgi:hypothetical protein